MIAVRRTLGIGSGVVTAVVLAILAGSAASSDIYITGKVLAQVAGRNAALVQITWAYKCLGDKLGAATYDWTLKVVRQQPLPEKTTLLGHGTTKFGKKVVQLSPGEYLPISDPYRCETERGAGYDKPEIGAPFTVPDYCSWIVSSTRGLVQLEHGSAVKVARPGSTVAPGDALVTPKRGLAAIASTSADGAATLAGSSRLELDAKRCASKGGWKLRLAKGSATAVVKPAAGRAANFLMATGNATAAGSRGARWKVDFAKATTTVRVLSGQVRVAGKTGPPVLVKAGRSVTVRGSGQPS